jgi:hypothetical protein
MTNTLNPVAAEVMRLILNEGVDAAEKFVNETIGAKVRALQQELVNAHEDESKARGIINFAKVGSQPAATQPAAVAQYGAVPAQNVATPAGSAGAVLDDVNKRDVITSLARQIAFAAMDNTASTEEVLKELAKQGKSLPGARPGTSIGNILNRDPAWERISEGVFRLKEVA